MFLRQSTAQTIRIGPFIDDTDFVSEEVSLTISAADIRLSKDGGNMVSCSVGGTHDEVGYYSVALGTGDTDTVGTLDIMVSETGTLFVKHQYYVVEEAVYDAMLASGAALNVGTAASVTGAVGSVTGNVGGALLGNVQGDVEGNVDGSTASVTGAVGSVTGAVGSVTGAVGSVTGSVGSVVGAVASVTGAVGSVTGHTAQTGDTFALANGAAGFSAINTDVEAILADTSTAGVVLATDSVNAAALAADAVAEIAAGITASGDPYAGAVWLDADSGTAGTTVGTHGLPGNPVDNMANAVTLADVGKTGLFRVNIADHGTPPLALVAGIPAVQVVGIGMKANINLNAQAFGEGTEQTATTFQNCWLQGTSTGGIRLVDCAVATATALFHSARDTVFTGGTISLLAGNSQFYSCSSQTTAASFVTFDLATNGSMAIFRQFSGALEFQNMDATNTVDVEGTSTVTINANCTAGTLTVRGDVTVIDNSSGAVTLVQVSGVNLTQINGETAPALTLQRILDATIDTTVTSGASTTGFIATGIPTTNDDQLIDKTGVFIDGNAKLRGFVIADYVDSTKTVTVDLLNVAPTAGDRFLIFA